MRTKEIKIEGAKQQAILIAGGDGFKIYSVVDLEGWVLAIERKISFINDNAPEAQTVADYVNIHYHSSELQEQIKAKFEKLVSLLRDKQAPAREATL